jgi:hypothetical protein
MSTNTATNPKALMYRLVQQAESNYHSDRRTYQRFPFFGPITLKVDELSRPAFVRDISDNGMGLFHNFELKRDEQIDILVSGEQRTLQACVKTCQQVGDGWYISGCRILGA